MQLKGVPFFEIDPSYVQKKHGVISEDIHWKYAEGYMSSY